MPTPSASPAPAELTQRLSARIVDAVAKRYGMSSAELKLMPEESFASETEAGAYCFMVLHSTGFFGVYAKPDGKGDYVLEATNLQ